MDAREEVLEKIRKCMALAKSGNEHEAAAALRQAQKLMELYQVSNAEMLAIGVRESRSKSGAASFPAAWEVELASHIAAAFCCKIIFSPGWDGAWWIFIGLPPANDVAAYSFDVMLRQALKARRGFIESELRRTKRRANKTRKADLYSAGWVHSACAQVGRLTPQEGAAEAIGAHMQLNHPRLGDLKTNDRNSGRNWSDRDHDIYGAGRDSGKDARLHQGVGTSSPLMLGGK